MTIVSLPLYLFVSRVSSCFTRILIPIILRSFRTSGSRTYNFTLMTSVHPGPEPYSFSSCLSVLQPVIDNYPPSRHLIHVNPYTRYYPDGVILVKNKMQKQQQVQWQQKQQKQQQHQAVVRSRTAGAAITSRNSSNKK